MSLGFQKEKGAFAAIVFIAFAFTIALVAAQSPSPSASPAASPTPSPSPTFCQVCDQACSNNPSQACTTTVSTSFSCQVIGGFCTKVISGNSPSPSPSPSNPSGTVNGPGNGRKVLQISDRGSHGIGVNNADKADFLIIQRLRVSQRPVPATGAGASAGGSDSSGPGVESFTYCNSAGYCVEMHKSGVLKIFGSGGKEKFRLKNIELTQTESASATAAGSLGSGAPCVKADLVADSSGSGSGGGAAGTSSSEGSLDVCLVSITAASDSSSGSAKQKTAWYGTMHLFGKTWNFYLPGKDKRKLVSVSGGVHASSSPTP